MIELYTIEQLESELQILYSKLEHTSDKEKKEYIQQAIQRRNLKLSRMLPNE